MRTIVLLDLVFAIIDFIPSSRLFVSFACRELLHPWLMIVFFSKTDRATRQLWLCPDYVRSMLNVPKKWDNPGRSWNRLLRVTVRVRIMVERTMTNYLRNVWFMTRLRLLSVETEKSWDIWFIVKHLEKTFPRK